MIPRGERMIPRRDTPAIDWLHAAGAYNEWVTWAQTEGIATVGEAWDRCTHPDWLLWMLDAVQWPARTMTAIACWCVRHTKMPDGSLFPDHFTDPRSRRALEVAESWVLGIVDLRELQNAHEDARDAVREIPYHEPADRSLADSMLADHTAMVGLWVATPPGRRYMLPPAVNVSLYLDGCVKWVAVRDGCNQEVAMNAARAARVNGIRSLIDPWAPHWAGLPKPKGANT